MSIDNAVGAAPDYVRSISTALSNPGALQRMAISHVEGILNGEVTLVDASNPFVTLMGVNSANVAALQLSQIKQFRKMFPKLATSAEELYPHMSDNDYIGRFAVPHVQKVTFIVPVKELRAKAVVEASGDKVVHMPRYTTMTVDGLTFTLLYPVIITEKAHGGWSARYVLDDIDPIHRITNSIIYLSERTSRNDQDSVLFVELEMVQISTKSVEVDLNSTTGLNKTIALSDSFCYARVWYKGRNNTSWSVMRTTHDEVVHDENVPTAVLQVIDGAVRVRIPQVYFSSGMVSGKCRIDIYTTKGAIYLDATGKPLTDFSSDFTGDGLKAVTGAQAAFGAIANKYLFFTGVAVGGRNALTFEELRERVIMNVDGPMRLPVTPTQLTKSLEDGGFVIRQYVNNVTATQLLASRALPSAVDRSLITPASATIDHVMTTMAELKSNAWVGHGSDGRITITPNAMWTRKEGTPRICSVQEMSDIVSMDVESQLSAVNSGAYMYSPFHYVLDPIDDTFDVRAYFLEASKIAVERFVAANDTTRMQIGIKDISIESGSSGWDITVVTTSNDVWKEQDTSFKHAQLSFIPVGVGTRAAVDGFYAGTNDAGEDVFTFSLDTGFDIDGNHRLVLTNFESGITLTNNVFAKLKERMQITFASSALMDASSQPSPLDGDLVHHLLPNRVRAIAAHEVTIEFGNYLENLWTAARTLQAAQTWSTYQSDVPEVYANDVFEVNPINNTILFFNPDGTSYTKLLHKAGDPIYEDGQMVLRHRKGEVIYRGGLPVSVDQDSLRRQFAMLFLEGCYRFATDQSTTTYADQVARVLTSYIVDQLGSYASKTLERTNVYFYPQVTLGNVEALVDNNVVSQIAADQSFTVRLGVQKRVFENTALTKELKRMTIEIIYRFLDREVVAISDLIDELRGAYAGDVVSIAVTGLAGGNADVVTLLKPNERLSLKKVLTVLENGDLTVREAVTIDIFNHTTEK